MNKNFLALGLAAALLAPQVAGAEGFAINEWSAEGVAMGGARMFAEDVVVFVVFTIERGRVVHESLNVAIIHHSTAYTVLINDTYMVGYSILLLLVDYPRLNIGSLRHGKTL